MAANPKATPPELLAAAGKILGLPPDQVSSLINQSGTSSSYDPFAPTQDMANGTLYVGTGAKEGTYVHKRIQLGNYLFAVDVPGGTDVQVQPQTTQRGDLQWRVTFVDARTGRATRDMTVDANSLDKPGPGMGFIPKGEQRAEFITQAEKGKGRDKGKTVVRIKWQGEDNANLRTPTDATDSISHQLKSVYAMAPEQILALKKQMWMAGMYPTGTKAEQLNGLIDDQFVSNVSSVMVQASRYYLAGKKVTWQGLLQSQAQQGPGADGTINPTHIDFTSDAELTDAIQSAASDKIGQKATPEDVRAYIAAFHAKEQAQQAADQSNVDTLTEKPNVDAEANAYLRMHYPNEMKGVEWADRAAEWTQLLATGSGEGTTGVPPAQKVEIL